MFCSKLVGAQRTRTFLRLGLRVVEVQGSVEPQSVETMETDRLSVAEFQKIDVNHISIYWFDSNQHIL